MSEGVKRDVKLLLLLAVALALFNVISLQVVIFSNGGDGLRTDFPENILPGEEHQQGVVVTTPGSSDNEDNNFGDDIEGGVYQYINDRLRKYGYGPIDSSGGEIDQGSGSSLGSSGSVPGSDDGLSLGGGSEEDSSGDGDDGPGSESSEDDENDASDDSEGGDDDGDSGDQESEDDDSGDEVPPSEDGPQAESVEGKDLNFNFGFGVE